MSLRFAIRHRAAARPSRITQHATLFLALLAGCAHQHQPPAKVAAPRPLFRDVAAQAGLRFRWGHASLAGINALETIGHGCAFLDYDGDGRLDILLVGNSGCRLYRNLGAGRFEDVSASTLPPPPAHCHFLGCAVADYDGDGRPDIYLTGYGSTALYHNEGGRFRDVTRGSGLEARGPCDWTSSAAWADVDGDGRLDLYVCRYVLLTPASKQLCSYRGLDGSSVLMACSPTAYPSQRGSLYRNLGSGRFQDITRQAGLEDTHGNGLGCMFCDLTDSGRPDLFIANDVQAANLYVNLGGGRFRNVAPEAGVAFGADGGRMSGMGIDWGDYDNDGRFDLLVANYASQPKALFHNFSGRDGPRFVDETYRAGLGAPSLLPLTFGAHFVDVDNSGLLDIVLTNGHVESEVERVDHTTAYRQSAQLFRNRGAPVRGQPRFVDASAEAGPDFTRRIVGRGMAVGDYDGDGRLDLLVVDDEGAPLLLHNESTAPNHWLGVRCRRRPNGPLVVGARVTVTAAGHTSIAETRAAGTYLSTDSPEVHFGLGAAARVDRVRVRWPNGRSTELTDLTPDRTVEVAESK